jgi:uncharacterized protein
VTLTHTNISARGRAVTRVLIVACLTGVLAACAVPRPAPPPVAPATVLEVIPITPLEQAQALLIEAESTPDPAPSRHAIDAVLTLDEAEDALLLRADRLWSLLPGDGRATLADRYRGARLAALQGDRGAAKDRLPPVDDTRDGDVYRDALELHAALLAETGSYEEALRARVALDPRLLNEPERQLGNQETIWYLLSTLEPDPIDRLATLEPDIRLRGWAALFAALRAAGTNAEAFDQALQGWARDYPGHPARAGLPELREASLRAPGTPDRIAVLLPLTGALADLGNAILEGVSAEHYRGRIADGSLVVLDTGGDPELAAAHYWNAVREGAERVIGPLTREEVERILANGGTVPTLLLNRPSTVPQAPFSVLSLSPEDDARAAAREAIASDRRHALVLVPEGSFGDRTASAFREAFVQQGGRIADEYRFEARSAELNAQVGSMLAVNTSAERITRLASDLRLPLEGDPQVRADIDLIFVAGPARDLRIVVPHLHYHRAGRLPMLATSHAYEGRPQPALDGDLTGIRFPDAPWLYPELNPDPDLLESMTGPDGSASAGARLPRFAALGIDASRIATDLPLYEQAPHLEARGVAGTWTLHPLERIWYREPVWLEFRNGLPSPVRPETPVAMEE